MSLQVWLPLNGDLTDYGISGLTFENINEAITTASSGTGKTVANSFYQNAHSGGSLVSNQTINLGTQLSMFCWIKITTVCSSSSLSAIAGQHRYPVNTGMGITMKYLSSTTAKLSVNTGNGTSRTYNTYCGNTTLTAGNWYHVGFTYDGSTIRLYVNGNLDGTHSYTGQKNIDDYIGVHMWSFNDSTVTNTPYGGYQTIGYINDFRVYDHCVSAKEVKQLSQGLIAHYKLSAGGGNNLLINTSSPSSTSGLAGVPATCSVVYDSSMNSNVFQSSTTSTGETYIYSSRTPQISSSTKYTFSCDVWANNYVKSIETFWLSDTSANKKTGTGYVNVTNSSHAIPVRNEWFHLTWTFTTKSDDYSGYIRFDNNGSSTSGTAAILKITNLKLEKGEIESPYSPAASESIFSPGDDSSGYQHHGTVNGSIEISAGNGGRNEGAAIFTGSNYIACGRGPMVRDEITVNWWGYMDNWSLYGSAPMRALSCTEGGGWNFEPNSSKMSFACGTGQSSNAYKSVTSTVTFSNLSAGWHMFTGSWNGLASKIYIDGVLSNTNNAYTTKTPLFYNSSNGIFIGSEAGSSATSPAGPYFTGKLSDVRIYCTALSDTDILALYQISASATNRGGLLGYNFREKIDTYKIYKNGIVQAQNFTEQGELLTDIHDQFNGMHFAEEVDGSTWVRIFYHNNKNGSVLFTSYAEVMNSSTQDKYSRLNLLPYFKAADNKYEFMLKYPTEFPDQYNRWKQTDAPQDVWMGTSDSSAVAPGYEAIHIDWTDNYWGGLGRQNSGTTTITSTFISGSVGHGNWFYAIGASSSWNSKIPGPSSDTPISDVELWVRVDTLPTPDKLNIVKNKYILSPLLQEI